MKKAVSKQEPMEKQTPQQILLISTIQEYPSVAGEDILKRIVIGDFYWYFGYGEIR